MWFGYSWFWNLSDFIPTVSLGSPDQNQTQTCPDQFFPELKCPLGKPLTPPQKVAEAEWEYIREYEHAKVFVDLSNQSATKVVFSSC